MWCSYRLRNYSFQSFETWNNSLKFSAIYAKKFSLRRIQFSIKSLCFENVKFPSQTGKFKFKFRSFIHGVTVLIQCKDVQIFPKLRMIWTSLLYIETVTHQNIKVEVFYQNCYLIFIWFMEVVTALYLIVLVKHAY